MPRTPGMPRTSRMVPRTPRMVPRTPRMLIKLGLYCSSCSWALAGGVRTEQTAYIDGLIIAFNDHSYHLGTPN